MCGLKLAELRKDAEEVEVTPFVGVWIETLQGKQIANLNKSHPSWVCGLKQEHHGGIIKPGGVTPFVGVWIETHSELDNFSSLRSHPSWVCGLKLVVLVTLRDTAKSHPSWVCGLKHHHSVGYTRYQSHTLRGCVD